MTHCWLVVSASGDIRGQFTSRSEADHASAKQAGCEVVACEEYFARESKES